MIILDTNVLSALMHTLPDREVTAWLDRQPRTSVWTTSITVLEIRFGLQILPVGKRRTSLMEAFEALLDKMSHRVVPFDIPSADHAANLMATRRKKGRPVDLRDTMIAGIVVAHRAVLATRNVSHFGDISATVVNPWTA